ncbi:phosphonoacetaldehyde hydrolase [Ectobacillus sp. JY-23]|uniref:phosphonoacetaldehyde hydrolase n=1 Tax=Ectobacillus sp. JY-23 TaxID=2933872 RepID=UPI001FF48974|nr:phosphonoacetaldehyde hydrolase [Ectobacillus sp. JY-23]UOY91902.1 phosphonoacetaldehyde hydrolase [Ectobacillus sp. JY-23]
MNKKIQAVILDWAGTTIDYGCFAPLEVFVDVFRKRGVQITIEEARRPMGLLKIDHIRALTEMPRIKQEWNQVFNCDPQESDIHEMYHDFETTLFTILPRYTTPVPGAVEMVARLRERGLKIGSTTGYTKEMMDIVVPEAKKQGYSPDCLVTPDQAGGGRPYPWMSYMNAMKLGVYPMSSIVKAGDTVSDIQEGRNSGMWTVGVIWGSSELGLTQEEVNAMDPKELADKAEAVRERFMEAGAHFTIDRIGDLDQIINVIEQQELAYI